MVIGEKPKGTIKLMQLNAGRAMKTVAELRKLVDTEDLQVIALQEPYTVKGKVASFGRNVRIVSGEKKGETAWAALTIFDPRMVVMRMDQYCDSHIVCAQIDNGIIMAYVISGYFQYSHPIDGYLDRVGKIVRQLHGTKIIICLDSNAESPIWHSDELSTKGEALENFTVEHNLYVMNELNNPATYSSPSGESNIDVTLVSESLVRKTLRWQVQDGRVSSDHNVITFEIRGETNQISNDENTTMKKFVVGKANWEQFDRVFLRKIDTMETPNDEMGVIRLARKMRRALIEACRESMPTKGRTKACAKWWTPELNEAKKEVHRLRKKFQRLRKNRSQQVDQEIDKREYHTARRQYDCKIYATRVESWKTFMTEASMNPWGYAYKLSCNEVKSQQAINSIRTSSGETTDWKESAEVLLNNLFCYDEQEGETEDQINIRGAMMEGYEGPEDEEPITESEIGKIIKKMKNGKAPGWDRIEVLVVKRAWELNREAFTLLFNECWKFGIFPNEWKKSLVVTLLKADDKDKSDPSSYRPICLLPVLGKVMEGIILRRLKVDCDPRFSERQFGFRSGRSTEDALHKFMALQERNGKKYVLSLFLDISNAFNNLWWPAIVRALEKMGCSKQAITITKDYLRKRSVVFRTESGSIQREVNKGCPQGSLLGPTLWNTVFNELLEEFERNGIEVVGFADDVVVVVRGMTRKQLEKYGQKAIHLAESWCIKFKMKLSENKTEMMLCSGKLSTDRPPKIKLGGRQIVMVEEFTYLGVSLQYGINGLQGGSHVRKVSERSKIMFSALRRVAKRDWGLGYKSLRIIYKGLFLATTTYAVSVWEKIINRKDWAKLRSAQRHALIGVICSYRTVSTEAVEVVAGEFPIDLEARRRSVNYALRKGLAVEIGNRLLQVEPGDIRGKSNIRREVKRILIMEWQDRWMNSEKGRTTFEYLRSVKERIRRTWIEPNFYLSQMMTGHGNFAEKLTNLKLKEDPMCKCGNVDNSDHVLSDCKLFDEERRDLVSKLMDKGIQWPADKPQLLTKEAFPDFKEFVTKILKKKEELEHQEE